MKLSCPSCGAKYSIADEKVSDRLAKIRCRKCSATIIVDGKVNPPNVYTSSEAAPAPSPEENEPAGGGVSSGEYSVDFGDNDQRTLTTDDIVQAYRRGELTLDTFVWAEGFADWQPISNVPELASTLNAVAAPAPARAAARTGGGRGSATDLFGGIDTAGSEEDVMTSAPQAGGGLPAAPMLAATGARNESSVLFSLSALTASAPAPMTTKSTPAISAAVASAVDSGDDSGLIDLKALTSAAAAQAPVSPLTLGTAPLGMAAPLGGMTAPAIPSDRPSNKQGGSKTGIYIAAALVVVGALIAGAIVFTGNREPAVAAAAAPTPLPSPAVPAPAETTKKDEPTAEPPATGTAVAEAPKDAPAGSAAATAAAAPKPVAASKPASGGIAHSAVKSKPVAAAEKPAEKPAAKPEPAADAPPAKPKPKKEKTCNCSPGDLMCAMKCAAT